MEIALLDNNKTIKDLVGMDTHDTILEFICKELSADEYNFIVTNDNLSFAKSKMADLNKSIKLIDTFRKEKVSAESLDIDMFKSNIKDYVALIDKKREEIKNQVEVFEKETKDKILKELSLYSQSLVDELKIRNDFVDVDIVDLIVLGSVTAKGALTKKARETVEARVNKCKSKQDKYDMRLMQLENESFKAGLESPLTITHVQGIILLDDDIEYENNLKGLISSEIARQDIIKSNLAEAAEREAQQNVLNEQNRIRGIFSIDFNNLELAGTDTIIASFLNTDFSSYGEFADFAFTVVDEQLKKLNDHRDRLLEIANNALKELEQKETEPVNNTRQVSSDKEIVTIKAMFEITVPLGANRGQIINALSKKLTNAGITSDSLKTLEVME